MSSTPRTLCRDVDWNRARDAVAERASLRSSVTCRLSSRIRERTVLTPLDIETRLDCAAGGLAGRIDARHRFSHATGAGGLAIRAPVPDSICVARASHPDRASSVLRRAWLRDAARRLRNSGDTRSHGSAHSSTVARSVYASHLPGGPIGVEKLAARLRSPASSPLPQLCDRSP